jgi:hypothetical protein
MAAAPISAALDGRISLAFLWHFREDDRVL